MSRQRLILAALLLGFSGLLGYYLSQHLDWEKTSHRTGFKGEALMNPYHAGMLLMKRLGYVAEQIKDTDQLEDLPEDATLLLPSSEGLADKPQRERLLAWVRKGGHLVLQLDANAPDSPLARELGLEVLGRLETPKGAQPLTIENDRLMADLEGAPLFRSPEKSLWVSTVLVQRQSRDPEDEDEKTAPRFKIQHPDKLKEKGTEALAVFARFGLGKGLITVGQLDGFRSTDIEKFDHGRLFVRILTLPEGKRPIFLMLHQDYPNLFVWLLRHAPEAVFALALLLLATIWHFAPRFGPLLPEPEPVRPSLRDHLSASGRFILKAGAYEALIAPLREDTRHQLTLHQTRHPDIPSLPELGAFLFGLPSEEIRQALEEPPKTVAGFLQHCQTLASLRARCRRMKQPESLPGNLS